ncbi:hypothetical protein F2P79_008642 [Pimephales promelas]|nr:hypothetical protein F2P79_008642 [Pimephales promelas]
MSDYCSKEPQAPGMSVMPLPTASSIPANSSNTPLSYVHWLQTSASAQGPASNLRRMMKCWPVDQKAIRAREGCDKMKRLPEASVDAARKMILIKLTPLIGASRWRSQILFP